MEGVYVFEDVWSRERSRIPLQKVARQHIELAELFLKLIPHLGTDDDGNINDEALAYSEWRYIVYLRFLDTNRFSPNDHPPPLDVALIWYCHVMTPSRFHGHLWTGKTRFNPTFGLVHRQFPMTKVLSMEWSPRETKRFWDKWNRIKDKKQDYGHHLPYQLWPSPPWEDAASKRRHSTSTGLLSRLLKRASIHGGEPNQPTASSEAIEPYTEKKAARPERKIVMQTWNRCALGSGADLPKTLDMASYTTFRTWKRDERCKGQSSHEKYSQQCELRPWPALQDLRTDLDRLVCYWKTLIQARDTIPRFTDGLTEAVEDYKKFLFIFREGIARFKKGHYVSKFDPKVVGQQGAQPAGPSRARFGRLMPPTLEVDLLWRTHRLYPGSYWRFSLERAFWVVEPEHTVGAGGAKVLLAETRQEWKKKLGVECPTTNSVETWLEAYLPDTAIPALGGIDREPLDVLLNGLNERPSWAIRRSKKDSYNPGGGGGGVGGDSSGCGGDGGGGGGE